MAKKKNRGATTGTLPLPTDEELNNAIKTQEEKAAASTAPPTGTAASPATGASPNGEADEVLGVIPSYTDKKGQAWKRVVQQRFPKAERALERFITLGNWNNYHYTQREAKAVCAKLRAIVARIEKAHQRDDTKEDVALSLPWDE